MLDRKGVLTVSLVIKGLGAGILKLVSDAVLGATMFLFVEPFLLQLFLNVPELFEHPSPLCGWIVAQTISGGHD